MSAKTKLNTLSSSGNSTKNLAVAEEITTTSLEMSLDIGMTEWLHLFDVNVASKQDRSSALTVAF